VKGEPAAPDFVAVTGPEIEIEIEIEIEDQEGTEQYGLSLGADLIVPACSPRSRPGPPAAVLAALAAWSAAARAAGGRWVSPQWRGLQDGADAWPYKSQN
jgi:hypothetical protein